MDFFIQECGDILGVSDKVKHKNDAKSILSYVLGELLRYKKSE